MPLFNMQELRRQLAPGQRLIGLDPGTKTIGVALSDVALMVASSYASLRRSRLKANAADIRAIAEKEGAGGIVIGLPLSMDGRPGRAAQAVRDWAHAIAAATGLPVALFDERLSTEAVSKMLVEEADMSRKRRAELVDRMAAAYVLQVALEASAE
jgi:putative Holliday junction resolvase